ncbi:MAG: peptidylprolyl isomerase [Spirochaetales bacterium]|nr:peptidylprolyl isomerase [Spirochaetales bacterium]
MTVTDNTQVTIHYTFSTSDGRALGSSDQSGPFAFVPGRGDAVPGLESRILGAKKGESFRFEIPAAEAYGEWDEDKEFQFPPSALEGLGDIEVGMRVSTTMEGRSVDLVITEITPEQIVLDANHPLAGHDIVFEGLVAEIEEAPEMAAGCGCGHSCGCGGH